MELIRKHLTKNLVRIEKQLAEILEAEQSAESLQKKLEAFEVITQKSAICGLSDSLPEPYFERVAIVFQRLSFFFDAGVVLENQDGFWTSQAYFKNGHCQMIPKIRRRQILLPLSPSAEITRGQTGKILFKLDLREIDPLERMTTLLFRPTPDFAFVLLSSMPDIWLKDHAEAVQKELVNCFC